MTERSASLHVPRYVPLFNPITRFLLRAGVPLGLNGLITVQGRTSGLPRTNPIAIIDADGRRFVWCPWGEAQWVRNLRAAGRATIARRGKEETVEATELDYAERITFFRDIVGPIARSVPLGYWFIRIFDGTDLNHPVQAADGRVVFELRPTS
jgi:deazaflavin-dependent oxidoreductase (nitroreductase family)